MVYSRYLMRIRLVQLEDTLREGWRGRRLL